MKRFYPIIAGPTASGKTAVSVLLAQRLGGEVVSADSMQIYDGVSVGTARPGLEEQKGIPHHLMGFVPLDGAYSVGKYVEDATAVFDAVYSRGNTPVLCGGTGLYIQSFMENISFLPTPEFDPAIRAKYQRLAEEKGGKALLEVLEKVDKETASRLHENDWHRIIRALEVYETTGQTISRQREASHKEPSPFTPCLFVLQFRNRETLYTRIEQRVDNMMQNGLLEEARRVFDMERGATVLQAIGYKEFIPYFRGECSLEDAVATLKTETRHYAKRQLSWFRRMEPKTEIMVDDYASSEDVVQAIYTRYEQFIKEG